jgi:hypothetical protein
VTSEERYCPECGTQRRPDDRYCARCGRAFVGGSRANTPTPQRREFPFADSRLLEPSRETGERGAEGRRLEEALSAGERRRPRGRGRWPWVLGGVVLVALFVVALLTQVPQSESDVRSIRCTFVSGVFVTELESALTVSGGGSLRAAYAVRSNDFEKVWFIAAEIQGLGMEGDDEVAIWATNIPPGSGTPSGMIFAVNGFAEEFSVWPTGSDISGSDDGASEARGCVRARFRQ